MWILKQVLKLTAREGCERVRDGANQSTGDGQRHTCMPTVGIQREKYGYTINNENIQSSTEENRKVLFAERNLCESVETYFDSFAVF